MRASVRQELVQLLLDEVAYRGRPEVGGAPASWAAAAADILADREAFGGCPNFEPLDGLSAQAKAVLFRWTRFTSKYLYLKARKAVA